jgi:tellurite resistance protein
MVAGRALRWPRDASLRNLPVSLFASVMGFAGLALAWRVVHAAAGLPAWIGEAAGAWAVLVFLVLTLAYLAKTIRHPQAVCAEFQHPVAGNFFGTFVISLLLLSAVTGPYDAGLSHAMWTAGVVSTLCLTYVVTARLLRGNVDPDHALPAWFVPCVATLDIPVTGAQMPMAWAAEVNLLACAIGTVLAAVLFVVVLARLVHRAPLAPAAVPSLMVLMAPFAVGCLAWTRMTGRVDGTAALLFYFALFLFVVTAPKIFRAGVPFSTTWWTVGFPLAALANAAAAYAQFRAAWPLYLIAAALLITLILVLAVLTVRTLRAAFNGSLFVRQGALIDSGRALE